ncbi:YcxB family protein [Myxococcota bacterium]|nr:YcxB family protein [Myxococcota bacterium]
MYETTLIYEESVVSRAVRCYWRRSLGVGYWIALLMVVVSLGVLLVQGTQAWILVTLTATTVLAVGFAALFFIVHYRSSLGRFRRMVPPEAKFAVDDETFAFTSSMGEAKLKWSVIRELWKFDDLWLILYAQGGFNVLPVAGVLKPMREFIEDRVKASGGKIR